MIKCSFGAKLHVESEYVFKMNNFGHFDHFGPPDLVKCGHFSNFIKREAWERIFFSRIFHGVNIVIPDDCTGGHIYAIFSLLNRSFYRLSWAPKESEGPSNRSKTAFCLPSYICVMVI